MVNEDSFILDVWSDVVPLGSVKSFCCIGNNRRFFICEFRYVVFFHYFIPIASLSGRPLKRCGHTTLLIVTFSSADR